MKMQKKIQIMSRSFGKNFIESANAWIALGLVSQKANLAITVARKKVGMLMNDLPDTRSEETKAKVQEMTARLLDNLERSEEDMQKSLQELEGFKAITEG